MPAVMFMTKCAKRPFPSSSNRGPPAWTVGPSTGSRGAGEGQEANGGGGVVRPETSGLLPFSLQIHAGCFLVCRCDSSFRPPEVCCDYFLVCFCDSLLLLPEDYHWRSFHRHDPAFSHKVYTCADSKRFDSESEII